MTTMNRTDLASNFNKALQSYFNEPTNKKYQSDLVWAAFHIHEYAREKYQNEHPGSTEEVTANDYIHEIAEVVHQAQPYNIKISEEKAKGIQRVINGLPRSTDARNKKAFQVVNLTYEHYLKNNLISAQEDRVRSQLFKFHEQVSLLKDDKAFEKMNNTGHLLETIINEHFSLPPEEQTQHYPGLVNTIKEVLNDSKQAVDKNLTLKTIAYNLVAAVIGLGVFYGIYLYKTRENRSTFFLETSDSATLKAATTGVLNTLEEDSAPSQEGESEPTPTTPTK